MTHEQEEVLENIRNFAVRYAAIESKPSNEKTEAEREWRTGILRSGLTKLSPGEVVYFCQHVISNMKNHQSASDALTVLANRLLHNE